MSQKVRYASLKIDPVINGFNPNEVKSHFHICDHLIVTFFIRGLCLVFSNTSHVDSLDRYRKSFVGMVKIDVCIHEKKNNSTENNMRIQYANECFQNLGMGDPTTCIYLFIYDEHDNDNTKIIQYIIICGLVLCIKLYSYVSHMFYAWSFSHNTEFPISINKNRYFLSLKIYTTVFSWGGVNSNENRN